MSVIVPIEVYGTRKRKRETYYIEASVWSLALITFDQMYPRWKALGRSVSKLAEHIAHELMPESSADMFSATRLKTCILSVKGKAGAAKRNRLSSSVVQLSLL